MDILEYLVSKEIEHEVKKNGFVLIKKCVACDGEDKLYVNISNPKYKVGSINCFKCNLGGLFENFVALYENTTVKEIKKRQNDGVEENVELFQITQQEIDKVKNSSLVFSQEPESDLKFVSDAKEFDLSHLSSGVLEEGAREYLLKRGASIDDAVKMGVLCAPLNSNLELQRLITRLGISTEMVREIFSLFKERKSPLEAGITDLELINGYNQIRELNLLKGRIVFPVEIGKKIIGYVARDYTGKNKIKVLNSTGPMTSDFFWGFNNVKKSDQIVITEGIFSAISCGVDRSIALLGKNSSFDRVRGISNNNKFKLFKLFVAKKYYVYLDVGAYADASDICNSIMSYIPTNSEVYFVNIPTILVINSFLNEKKINECGIFYQAISEKKIYISYDDQQACKFAVKWFEITDMKKSGMIKGIVERMSPAMKKKIYRLKSKLVMDKHLISSLKAIASGDFMDSNDFGPEINAKIINSSQLHVPYIDYEGFSSRITKIP